MNTPTEQLIPFPVSNSLLAQPDALRERFSRDGFVFFKQILPREKLRALRAQFTRILAEEGFIEGGEAIDEARAIGKPFREGTDEYFQVHDRVVRLEDFHALAHDDRLMEVMRAALGESAFPHPLSIARLIFPKHREVTTPAHQDFPNNQGSQMLTAAWIPLGDCPKTMGPIKVLGGSHRFGLLPLRYHLGPGGRRAEIPEEMNHLTWYASPFEAGDVLLFGALTVHAAMDNLDAQRMRLSVDYRYQLEGEPLTPGCLEPHFQRLSWEQIYRGWKSDALKYYWRKKDYQVVDWDDRMHELPPEEAEEGLKMALRYAIHRDKLKIKL